MSLWFRLQQQSDVIDAYTTPDNKVCGVHYTVCLAKRLPNKCTTNG